MSTQLWDLRVDKVIAELKEGRRGDSRKIDEYRKLEVIRGIGENADGSARVKLGNTDVVAGVKMMVGEPYPDSPDEGSISVGAELLPLASPDFEFGPPREGAIELSRVVDRGIRESGAVDFKGLSIVGGESCWVGFVDIYAINHDGNLFDACSIAAVAALLETKMPKLENNKVVKGEYKGKLSLKCRPVLNTFAKVGNVIVVDPALSEEKAMNARFSVCMMDDDGICAYQKGLSGSFTISEINGTIDTAIKNSKQIRKLL